MAEISWHIGLSIVAALLLLNAVFVATEFALVTVRRTRLERMAETDRGAARFVLRSLRNLDYYVAASQLGITMASIALGAVGEPVLARLIEPPVAAIVGSFAPAVAHGVAIAVAFLFVTSLHIVVGEFVPKTIALQQPERTAMAVAVPVSVFVRVAGPAIWLLNATGNALLRLFGMTLRPVGEAPLSTEDLAFTLESSASAGLISRRELDLTRHALHLGSTDASALMVPRSRIAAIPEDVSREGVLRVLAQHGHTRYPVYREQLDNIVGIIDARRVLLDEGRDWRTHVQAPVVLPETVPIAEALEAARDEDQPLVILIDEYGGTAGLLSYFDVAEYLAGRLPGEVDMAEPFRRNPDGSLVLSGLTRILDLEEELGLELPDEGVNTVAGLVLERLNRIPVIGDEITLDGFRLRVMAMDRYRIRELLLTPTEHAGRAGQRGAEEMSDER